MQKANATGTASWYYRGAVVSSNASVSLNTGDSLTISCNAIAAVFTGQQLAPIFIIMFATTSTTNPVVTVTFTSAQSPTPVGATVGISGGTLIYDSYNGVRSTWAHWMISNTMLLPVYTAIANAVTRGIMTIYIPYLISTDAGTMYCFFSDAYTSSASQLAVTNGFTLTLTTKSGANTNMARNKYLEYSMALLGASKLVL